jgi:hypothetical protein
MDTPTSVTAPSDSDTPLARRAGEVQRHWFDKLPQTEKTRIIEKEFNTQHPSHGDKARATKAYADYREKMARGWGIPGM